MISLGIDCATHSGWAVVDDSNGKEEIVDTGLIDFSKIEETPWRGARSIIDVWGNREGPDVIAIELPWLGKNVATTIKLACFCGMFMQEMGRAWLVKPMLIGANEWQTKLLGTQGKRDRRKKAAIEWVRLYFGQTLPEDEADAVCIATYALRLHKIKTRTKEGKCR